MNLILPGGYHLHTDAWGGVWLLRKDNTPARLFSYREARNGEERASFMIELFASVMADSIFRARRGDQ